MATVTTGCSFTVPPDFQYQNEIFDVRKIIIGPLKSAMNGIAFLLSFVSFERAELLHLCDRYKVPAASKQTNME